MSRIIKSLVSKHILKEDLSNFNFKKEYRDLEMRVHSLLRDKIENSNQESNFTSERVIKVDLGSYVELAIINGNLTFLDGNGHQYSVFADTDLEDLIDILNSL